MASGQPILLFDGVCNLCNGIIRFLLNLDKRGVLRFASLQSAAGQAYLQRFSLHPGKLPSVVLVEGDRYSQRSTAALRVMRALGWPYRALYALILVPRPMRDLVYDLIAKNRYRIFGKRETCMLPTPALKARFLE
jgi:predicted DCC family thiol-disulfide oxidoreductase YuxK